MASASISGLHKASLTSPKLTFNNLRSIALLLIIWNQKPVAAKGYPKVTLLQNFRLIMLLTNYVYRHSQLAQKAYPLKVPDGPTMPQAIYEDMISGATNKTLIDHKVRQVNYKRASELVYTVHNVLWNCKESSIFNADELFITSLRATQLGLLPPAEVGTLNLFQLTTLVHQGRIHQDVTKKWRSFAPHNPTAFCLFENGSLNKKTFRVLKATYVNSSNAPDLTLDPTQEALFLNILKTKSLIEQTFLVVPHLIPCKGGADKPMWYGLNKLQFNIFGRFRDKFRNEWRVIPSYSMMQAYAQALTPDRFTIGRVRFGAISPSGIALDIFYNARIMGLPNPNVEPELNRADTYFAFAYDFVSHDFYHLILSSFVNLEHKKMMVRIWQFLGPKVVNRFHPIDMEHPQYYINHKARSDLTKFWLTIGEMCRLVGKRENQEKLKLRLLTFILNDPYAKSIGITLKSLEKTCLFYPESPILTCILPIAKKIDTVHRLKMLFALVLLRTR